MKIINELNFQSVMKFLNRDWSCGNYIKEIDVGLEIYISKPLKPLSVSSQTQTYCFL